MFDSIIQDFMDIYCVEWFLAALKRRSFAAKPSQVAVSRRRRRPWLPTSTSITLHLREAESAYLMVVLRFFFFLLTQPTTVTQWLTYLTSWHSSILTSPPFNTLRNIRYIRHIYVALFLTVRLQLVSKYIRNLDLFTFVFLDSINPSFQLQY